MSAHTWLRSIACISCLATLPAMGATFGDFTYTDNGADITITGCTGTGAIVVPPAINDKPVVEIANQAFSRATGVTSVAFPDSLTTIGEFAFRGCEGLEAIDVPDSVTSIGSNAFSLCLNLKRAKLPKGLEVLKRGLFWGCDSMEVIELPPATKVIGVECFHYCRKLRRIVLHDKLTTIKVGAFGYCDSLTEIHFPASLRKLDFCTFMYGGTERVYFDGPAPKLIDGEEFYLVPSNFRVFYKDGNKGYTWPKWNGVPSTPLGPEIHISGPTHEPIATRISTQSFGARVIGYPRTKVFTIRNIGTRTLRKLSMVLAANDGGDFTATTDQRGMSLEPGQTMKVKVTFRPTGIYERRAVLKIYSNDPNENPVVIKLRGLGM